MEQVELLKHILAGFFAFMFSWLCLMMVENPIQRVGLIAVLLTAVGAMLWVAFSGVATTTYGIALLCAEALLFLNMRSFEKRRAADTAFYQAAGAISGALALRRK